MSNIMLVTSCKGGVGKSTVAANLGMALGYAGKRTLLIDCDLGMRCLDLLLGCEDRVMYDIYDVMVRDIEFNKAVIGDEKYPNLFFCAAPYQFEPNEKFTAEMFKERILKAVEDGGYEQVIVDTAADLGFSLEVAASVADTALIVATHHPATIRGAERTGRMIDENEYGIADKRLIINCFDYKNTRAEYMPGIVDIIDKTYLQLIGIIPYSASLAEGQYDGKLMHMIRNRDYNTAKAFDNLAERVLGYNVPLLNGFRHVKRKRILS